MITRNERDREHPVQMMYALLIFVSKLRQYHLSFYDGLPLLTSKVLMKLHYYLIDVNVRPSYDRGGKAIRLPTCSATQSFRVHEKILPAAGYSCSLYVWWTLSIKRRVCCTYWQSFNLLHPETWRWQVHVAAVYKTGPQNYRGGTSPDKTLSHRTTKSYGYLSRNYIIYHSIRDQ